MTLTLTLEREMSLKERLRRARKAAGLSQEQVAYRAGITVSALRKVEDGSVTDPKLSTLLGLRRVLRLDLEELAAELEREEGPGEEAAPERGRWKAGRAGSG